MKNKLKYLIIFLVSLLNYSEIIVDNNTNVYVEKANNGVEIINISTPSSKGVSDSTFTKFNVDNIGAILNNSINISKTNIAGYINANKNLTTPARLALLRVTSENKSEIKGILEAVSSKDLDVIISNKNGITLDGAKFLNIHDLVLTTGDVRLNNGKVEEIEVSDGKILSLSELNTSNVENLKILSKIAELEKDVYANNIEIRTGLVKTYDNEIGIPISASILGSIYGDNVKIIATKSGIGTKNIYANNLNIETEKDLINENKLIANERIDIKADNISNINGGLIYSDTVNIKANNLNNVGKVISYGNPTVNYYDLEGNKIDDVEKLITRKKEEYNSYNAGILSSTSEAKENALRAFYDEIVNLDHSEFDWRIYKDKYQAGENKKREGKPGIFYELEGSNILKKENIQEVVDQNREAMYSESSDNYAGHTEKNYIIKSKLELSDKETKFSVISGNNINIEVENRLDNKDGHILAKENNILKAKEFNNASSISEKTYVLKDVYERLNFKGTFNCPGGLIVCYITHSAEYERDLGNIREVSVNALPSYIKGENIEIEADTVNFKVYKEDESKKVVSEEDIKYIGGNEKVEIKGKEIEYAIEEASLEDFYKSPYFLNNLKYNSNEYIIDEFKRIDLKIKENEKREYKPSNILIKANNLNVKDQKLLFEKVKLSSNNILIEGAKLEALSSLEIDKNKNIRIVSSDVKSKDIRISSENLEIEDKIEEEKEEEIDVSNTLFKRDIRKKSKSISSNIESENLEIESKKTKILGSNILSNEIRIKGEEVNILNSVGENSQTVNTRSNHYSRDENEIYKISNGSNILANNLNIESKKTKIQDSDVTVINDLDVKGKLEVVGDKLEYSYNKNKKSIFEKENINYGTELEKGSKITVLGNTKVEDVLIKGSEFNTKTLEAKEVKVEADVLKTKEKVDKSSFKFVEDGYIQTEVFDKKTTTKQNEKLILVETKDEFEIKDLKNLSTTGKVTLFSHKEETKDNETERNKRAGLKVEENGKIEKLNILSSDVVINNGEIKEIDVDTTVLKNSIKENKYKGGLNVSFDASLSGVNARVGIDIENTNIKGTEKINEGSNISLLGKSKIEDKAEFRAANIRYDELEINAKKVVFDAKKDESDITTNITGVSIGVSANISSPILNDVLQIGEGALNILEGRVDKSLSNIGNGYVSGVNNLASNLKIKDEKGDYRQATKKDLSSGKVEKGLDGYINIGAEVGATISNKTIIEHKEEVKSGTLTGGKLKLNNNEKVKFVSTKVKDTKIEYNNVENVVKEVEVANNSKTTIDASVGVSFGIGMDAKDGSVRKGDVKVSVGFGIESEEEKINGINELENVEETFNGVGNVKLKGVVSENSKIKGKVENIEIEEVKDEKIVVGVKEGFDISISPITGIPTGANIEYGIKDKREEKAYKNELNLEELEYGSKEIKEVKEENHNYEFGIRAGTSGVSTNFNINDKFSIDISSKTMEAITNPKGFSEKIDLAKEEVESTLKGIEEGVKSLFKPEDNKVDMSKEEKRNYFEAGEAYIRYKNDEKIEKIKNAKIESQEDIDKLAKEIGIEGGLKVISEEDMQKIADVQKRDEKLAKEGEKLGIFVIEGKDGKKYLAITDPNQDINELKKGIAREYGINREIEEGRAKTNEEGDYLAATIGNIASENIEGKEEGEIELEYTEIDDNVKNGIVISDKPTEGARSWEIIEMYDAVIGETVKYPVSKLGYRNLIEDGIVTKEDLKKYLGYFDENKYNKDKEYREKINYYYYLEKNSLNDVKFEDIKFEYEKSNDKTVEIKSIYVKNKQGKEIKLNLLSPEESLFHNIVVEENGEVYINNNKNTRNLKFVNEDGYEIVINMEDKKVVTDPITRGTFNQDSGLGIFGLDHLYSDMRLYNKYGSGPDDRTPKKIKEKINKCTGIGSYLKIRLEDIIKKFYSIERINCE